MPMAWSVSTSNVTTSPRTWWVNASSCNWMPARLTLPVQDPDSPRGKKVRDVVEHLSFDPWHARDDLQYRWPVLLAIPVLAGGIGFALRGVRAVVWHASVSAEMTTNSALNIGSALSYLVIALAFHATLMALVVARLVAELRRLSRHDGLTGLLNRRAIEEALAEQVQRSRRNGEAFALMMLDVDHFKAINDHHGHAVGDLALKHVAALLRHGVRDVDHLSRLGGEEFVVLLPAATPAAALALAERLRENVEGSPPTVQQHVLPLTVSIGLAQWAGDADEPRQLLARADAALYRAKAAGRNRVVS